MGVVYNRDISKETDAVWAHKRGYLGTSVTVCIIDTGIVNHNSLIYPENRIVLFKDLVNNKKNPYDDSGHGVHVAGIIASNGKNVNGNYIGIAPKCKIIAIKVLNKIGIGKMDSMLRALEWVISNQKKYNIRILNISSGTAYEKSKENIKLLSMVEEVWDKGIVVVTAAGNNGPKPMTITIPGVSPKVITVGCTDSKSNNFSSRGPTSECVIKPDIVAPGSNIVSCMNASTGYITKSGTSMAAPIVSGAIALLLDKNPELSNKQIKTLLHDRAVDLGMPKNQQGWGMINIKRLLEN